MLGIDPSQILVKKRHAQAASPVFWRYPKEAQIVVRLMPWMCAAKAFQQFTDVSRTVGFNTADPNIAQHGTPDFAQSILARFETDFVVIPVLRLAI